MRNDCPVQIRFYFSACRKLDQLFVLIRACWIGVWLGLLDRETLHLLDKCCYDLWSEYHTEAHNRKGLTAWEVGAITNYFSACRRLLVAGIGGGRELLALCQLGYEPDGFECHPELAAVARRLLQSDGFTAEVTVAARDTCPESEKQYDGLIVGWGAYMLIQAREKRIAFLKAMRATVPAKAPLLLSFFHRSPQARRFKIITFVGNILRRIRRKSLLEVGDSLAPNYVHLFTRDELKVELQQAGFDLVFYDSAEYGHAVALASDTMADTSPTRNKKLAY